MTDENEQKTRYPMPTIEDLTAATQDYVAKKSTMEAINAKVDELVAPHKSALEAAEKRLAAMMIQSKVNNVSTMYDGKEVTAAMEDAIAPKVEDWDEVYAYIRQNNRFDLLHKRVSSGLINEMYTKAIDDHAIAVIRADASGEQRPTLESFIAAIMPGGVTMSKWKALKVTVKAPRKARARKAKD